jgi:hypothetical protein
VRILVLVIALTCLVGIFVGIILFQRPLNPENKTLGITTTSSDQTLTSFKITPQGPINPGESYEIVVTVINPQGELCKECGIKFYLDEPQPGDEVYPNFGRTDNDGKFYTKVTSFNKDRTFFVDVRYSEQGLNTSSTPLPYHNNPVLGTIRLIQYMVNKVGALPPLGNVYAKAVKQRYIGNDQREIFLEYNRPFGLRRYDIYVREKDSSGSGHLVKTIDKNTSIEVNAFKDLYIDVRGCTVGENCVDSSELLIPGLLSYEYATSAAELEVANFGFQSEYKNYLEAEQNEQQELESNPVLRVIRPWLERVYSNFK